MWQALARSLMQRLPDEITHIICIIKIIQIDNSAIQIDRPRLDNIYLHFRYLQAAEIY